MQERDGAAYRPHPIYSRDASVHGSSGIEKLATFHEVLRGSGFEAKLLEAWRSSGKEQAEFVIAIKPNIMTASIPEENSAVYTDPALVEELIHIMMSRGFSRFAVVESQNVYNYSYTERTVPAVAEMCGYGGEGYEIIDLTEDYVSFDYGGTLGPHLAGRAWLEADYRISFAKNKSHWQCFYTACLKNVYGCLPKWDKMRHYHGTDIEFFQATVLIADKIPVHFGILDAWTSGDGLTGHVRDPRPNRTKALLASDNIYALDWVAGEKMGIQPTRNYVMREALNRWGPIQIERLGDMTPWPNWNNVRPITVWLLNGFEEFYRISRFMSRAMASRMDPRFPPRSRAQWFFGLTQRLVRAIESLGTKRTSEQEQVRTYAMEL
jgi:uncharacterized protein (DUF362 family)